MTRMLILVAVGAAATPTVAQSITGTGTWLWTVTTDDGDAIVEPGETATIRLAMFTEADDPSYITTIAAAVFDTLGGENADRGQITGWQVLNELASLTGDLTTTDGVSLYNTNVGQLAGFYFFQSDNPMDVLEFTWATEDYTGYSVAYTTYSGFEDEAHTMYAWATQTDWYEAHAEVFDAIEASISFEVANVCYADFDGNGALNVLDYIAYQLAWHQGNMDADCNADGVLNILDYVCFHKAWHAGCA